MSWAGFKKAVNRAGQQVFSKRTETVEDPDFDYKEGQFERFEALINELSRDLERFKDGFSSITDTQVEIMKTLDSYYGEGDHDGISQKYLNQLLHFQHDVVPELSVPLNKTVLHPIEELSEYNEEIHKLIKKRGRKKFDYEVVKAKVDKAQIECDRLELGYRENSNETSITQVQKANEKLHKLQQEYHMVDTIYQDINTRLKAEMDQYIALRFSLLDPSFESFVKLQVKLFGDLELTEKVDALSQEDYLSEKLDDRLDNILEKMRGLDIHNM